MSFVEKTVGDSLIRRGLRAPGAAAVAGILFCVLLTTSYLLIWISVPANIGYLSGVTVVLSAGIILWVPLVFPARVLLISIFIRLENQSGLSPTTP
jgi:hypothetical protein